MSVVVRGKTIVTSSTDVGYRIDPSMLSLYVDARNPDSYPGSGTTWYDLSSGMHNISTALATYDSTSPASFSITGNNTPIINFTASVPTSVFTIETIIKPTSFGGAYSVFLNFGSAAFRIYFDNVSNILYWPGTVGDSAIANIAPLLNQWQYFVFELYNGQVPANSKLYKNGNLITLSGGTNPLYLTSYNNGMGQIFGDMSVSCSMFRTYNRALTQQEITNSYNYYKPIFNLA
jgi:hypothetical protein